MHQRLTIARGRGLISHSALGSVLGVPSIPDTMTYAQAPSRLQEADQVHFYSKTPREAQGAQEAIQLPIRL